MMTTLPNDPFAKLRSERASLRSDLQVSRQVQMQGVVYVLHDPVAFRTHRLSAADYFAALELQSTLTLQRCFDEGKKSGIIKGDDNEFFQFVIQLHQLELLAIPLHNGEELVKRHRQAIQKKSKSLLMSWMCIRIPLLNPDAFLNRTMPLVRFLFQPWFGIVWSLLLCITLAFVASRWSSFTAPINGLLAATNIPFLWISLIGLKVWHELGHGYACKHYGGRVPEMGAMFILGTPAAYCDSSAAWSFEKRRQRLLVMLGGMYFESLIAIPAVFVWGMAGNTFLGSCAFQVVFMASAVTILFNANPLMKYDGYFVLSELIGVQNLQARSTQWCKVVFRRLFLGLPIPAMTGLTSTGSASLRWTLFIYGSLANLYKIGMMIGIAVALAQLLGVLGMLVGFCQVGAFMVTNGKKIGTYLLFSKDAQAARYPALACFCALVIGLPIILGLVAIPTGLQADGVVGAEVERIVRVSTPGVLVETCVAGGESVEQGEPLVRLRNPEIEWNVRIQQANLASLQTQYAVERERELEKSAQTEHQIKATRDQLAIARQNAGELTATSPASGRVVVRISDSQRDRFLNVGEPIATIIDGKTVVRVWLEQEQLQAIMNTPGTKIKCRFPGRSFETFEGTLVRVSPATIEQLNEAAVTPLGGGSLIVEPETNKPMAALFELKIQLDTDLASDIPHGSRVSVSIPRNGHSILSYGIHNLRNFVTKVLSARA